MDDIIQAILAQYLQPKQVEVDEMRTPMEQGGMNQIQPQKGQMLPGMDALQAVAAAAEAGKKEDKGLFGLGIGPF